MSCPPQLLLEPSLVPPAAGKISPDDPAIVDENEGQLVLLGGEAKLLRCGGPLPRPRQNGELTGIFQYGPAYLVHGDIALSPELFQQLVQRVAVFPHGILLELAVSDEDGRGAAHQFPKTQTQKG